MTAKRKSSQSSKRSLPRKPDAPRTPSEPDSFPIVGVGASAGGLEALTQLLQGLPPTTGMAFVLVQHLAANHESILATLLARSTTMPVVEAEDGVKVAPDHVYVIPPDRDLVLRDGRLGLEPRPTRTGTVHMPVDLFLRTLAAAHDDLAIGVILSGTGTDGTLGIKAIKEAGGITIAQDPETAGYTGMPRSAIVSGGVDFVLAPERIGAELVRLAGQPPGMREPLPAEPADDGEPFQRLLILVRRATGTDFSSYRKSTLVRRIRRRMLVRNMEHLADYLALLQREAAEVHALHQDLLINVTSFFRDAETFEALGKTVLPELLKNRSIDDPLRVWVPGCSTGEEAYSLAITLLEAAAAAGLNPHLQIFGTDVSEKAVEKARAGIYLENIAQDVSPQRLARFFVKLDGNYQVSKPVRAACIFAKQDVTRDPPFSRIDLVSCRNLLIYLEPTLQRRVMAAFHYALGGGGYLVLGRSETVGGARELFQLVDREHKIYANKESTGPLTADFLAHGLAPTSFTAPRRPPVVPLSTAPSPGDLQREGQRLLLTQYGPPSVLVDANFNAVEFRGDTRHYLRHGTGEASLNLLKNVVQELVVDLRRVLQESKKTGAPARRDGIRLQDARGTRRVSIQALPLKTSQQEGVGGFLVVFEEAPPPPRRPPKESRPRDESAKDRRIGDLEDELAVAHNHLHATVEAHEAMNEELQAANEEVLSANEELQSINEELETAKEELQSGNEELITLNEELNHRNVELTRLGDDLTNALESVGMPIAVVDGDLLLRRFTPAAARLLNLIPGDIGRPLDDIRPNLEAVDLAGMVREAMAQAVQGVQGVQVEVEVFAHDQSTYSLRVMPYRTRYLGIDGAVLVFVDVSELRQRSEDVEAALRRERDATRRAEEAGRLKEAFVATVSHELRGPLNAMAGWLHILRDGRGGAESREAALQGLDHAMKSQLGLVSDLLDFSRIEAGRVRLNLQPTSLVHVVEAALNAARSAAQAKNLRLALAADSDDETVLADPDRLQQIVWNLLSNALKFTPKDGQIAVEVGRRGTHVEVAVRDSGRGMTTDELEHIFDRSRPIDPSHSRSEGGLGLGLSIVRQLIELHGGKVRAESRGPGKGAVFTVSLPLPPLRLEPGQTTAQPLSNTADQSHALAGIKVLLVDDDAEGREVLRRLLEMQGANVVAASNGADAAMALELAPPDVLISDIGMPDEDGNELLRRIRSRPAKRGGAVPAIALTAYASRDDRSRSLEAGFNDYLTKPVAPEELVAAVSRLAKR